MDFLKPRARHCRYIVIVFGLAGTDEDVGGQGEVGHDAWDVSHRVREIGQFGRDGHFATLNHSRFEGECEWQRDAVVGKHDKKRSLITLASMLDRRKRKDGTTGEYVLQQNIKSIDVEDAAVTRVECQSDDFPITVIVKCRNHDEDG
jgi:hypothetical protein